VREGDNRARKTAKDAEDFIQGATKSFQDNVTQAMPWAGASYTLIGAILLFGLIGYGLDRWLGTAPWLLLAGLLLGMITGFYELAKAVWRH
jgi:F0F1-type ATP synthase assembly protein I